MIGAYYWIGNTLEYIGNAHDFKRVIGEKLGYEAQLCFDEIVHDFEDRIEEEKEKLEDKIIGLKEELDNDIVF